MLNGDIELRSKVGVIECAEDLVGEVNAYISLDGGKKKKKKKYTTPKKNKHRHKSEKMMALRFFAVDKDG